MCGDQSGEFNNNNNNNNLIIIIMIIIIIKYLYSAYTSGEFELGLMSLLFYR